MKENIDGEAISWAFNRLKEKKREKYYGNFRWSSVDDSTLSVNSGDFLEKHLKKVVKFIKIKRN